MNAPQRIEIYCEGRPNNGAPTHDRWLVAAMNRGVVWETGQPYWDIEEVVTQHHSDGTVSYPKSDRNWAGAKRLKEYLVGDEVVGEDAIYDPMPDPHLRVHHQFPCLAPLMNQRRGCGLNLSVGDWSEVDRILDQLLAAGVSDVSLFALVRRLNPNT